MATVVNKTIGTGGDYADWDAFLAAAPASLVALDEQWNVKFKKQVFTRAGTFTFASKTTDATRYFNFTTDTDSAWWEAAGIRDLPLTLEPTRGATLQVTNGAAYGFNCSVDYTRFTGLQILNSSPNASTGPALYITSQQKGCVVDRCILDSYGTNSAVKAAAWVSGPHSVRNSLVILRGGDAASWIANFNSGATVENALCVSLNVKVNVGIALQYATTTLTNVGVFNATAPETVATPAAKTACATDATVTGWSTVPYSVATFASITPASPDFRLPAGSGLIDAGTAIGTVLADVTGLSRPQGAAYDIGPWEFQVADVTAPTLTNPTGAPIGATGGNGAVVTNEAGGTLYYLVSTASSATSAQVKAAASKPVTGSGSQSAAVSGLSPSTSYRFHFLHRDASGNDSAVVSSPQFTTGAAGDTTAPVLASPTGEATGATTAFGTVATNEAGGLLYRLASTAATGVTAVAVKAAGQSQSVDATGEQPILFTGLTAETTYYAYYVQDDSAGNTSAVVRSSAFTTQAAPVGGSVYADFVLSWSIEAPEFPDQGDVDGSKITASRKIVFPGGTRVVPFGTRPSSVISGAPSYEAGKWWSDKHPLDERYWVADISVDLAEADSTAVSVDPIVAGVTVLEQPDIQGTLIPIKLSGLDMTSGAVNYCTFRVTCANGEQFDRTIWFRPQQGKWELLKDPEDKRFYVADVENDLVDSNTTAISATAVPVGVSELVPAQVQDNLIVVKLGGMDTSPDPTNYCTLRIECANGERFYRTIHFTRVDN